MNQRQREARKEFFLFAFLTQMIVCIVAGILVKEFLHDYAVAGALFVAAVAPLVIFLGGTMLFGILMAPYIMYESYKEWKGK